MLKGKIERGIGYVKNNALKSRTFSSLAEQNKHLLNWERYVADTRIHGTTRKQVGKLFTEEKSSLLPLPASRFPCFAEGKRSVHRDGHVEVQKSYYSVPPEYVGREVWVRWDGQRRKTTTMSKVGLVSGIVCIVLAVIVFVFADGLRRWYSGIFFAFMGTVMLVNAQRWRHLPPGSSGSPTDEPLTNKH